MDVRIIITGNGDIRAYPVRYLPRQSREGENPRALSHCTRKPQLGDIPPQHEAFEIIFYRFYHQSLQNDLLGPKLLLAMGCVKLGN